MDDGIVWTDPDLAGLAASPAYRLLRRIDRRAVEVDNGQGCIGYRGCHDRDGYPRINVGGTSVTVCRAVAIVVYPWAGAGHETHHECHNRWCINPEHLTPLEKLAHRAAHRRKGGVGA